MKALIESAASEETCAALHKKYQLLVGQQLCMWFLEEGSDFFVVGGEQNRLAFF